MVKVRLTQRVRWDEEPPEIEEREFPSRAAIKDWVAGIMLRNGEEVAVTETPYRAAFFFPHIGDDRPTFLVEELTH